MSRLAATLYRGEGSFAMAVALAIALCIVGALLSGSIAPLLAPAPIHVARQRHARRERRPVIRLSILLHKRERGPNLPE